MSGDVHPRRRPTATGLGRPPIRRAHDDRTVSAIVVRDVPALVCDLCEEVCYEPHVTDAVVRLLA